MEQNRRPKFLLIDGFNLAFRCFYAIPTTLETRKNLPVNALYGFLRTCLALIEKQKPQYIVICLDSPTKTFRVEKDPLYKAQRKETPDALKTQLKILTEDLLPGLSLPQMVKEGFEADDLIASLVYHFKDSYDMEIFSNDNDLYQLLEDDRVQLLMPSSSLSETKSYNKSDFINDFGIIPDQYSLYKALVGDTSDNIKGISGIGPKTALNLIKAFGSFENMLKDDSPVTNKIRLQEAQIRHNLELIHLVSDLTMNVDADVFAYSQIPEDAFRKIAQDYEFHSLLKRYQHPMGQKNPAFIAENKTCSIHQISKTETDSMLGLKGPWSFYADPKKNQLYLYHKEAGLLECPLGNSRQNDLQLPFIDDDVSNLAHQLMRHAKQLVGFDIKKQLHLLGIPAKELANYAFEDLQLMFYLLYPNLKSYDIEEFELRYSQGFSNNLAILLMESWQLISDQIHEEGLSFVYNEIEKPLLSVLFSMEMRGIKISAEKLNHIKKALSQQIDHVQKEIHQMAGMDFNVSSPKQLAFVLFEKLKLPAIKKTKTGYSTDSEVLDSLQSLHPMIGKIKQYRESNKLLNTYVNAFMQKMDDQHQLHTTFLQAGPSTGRISSVDPNLQNLPADSENEVSIRSVFVPSHRDWLFVSADYSQIDLRVLAHYSEDVLLQESFMMDKDIHSQTARRIFHLKESDLISDSQRRAAKAINFGIIYGMSSFGLARSLKVSENEASGMIDRYFDTYPGVQRFREQIIQQAVDRGYVETWIKRKRPIPEIKSKNKQLVQLGERLAVNTVIQGTSADIIKIAMIQMHDELLSNEKCFLLLQIHDELIWESHPSQIDYLIALAKEKMENAVALKVPLKVHFKSGPNLSELNATHE